MSKSASDNEKLHIGIINLQMTHNYGAVIAAAVLEDIVKNIAGNKYIVDTINFAPKKEFGSKHEKLIDDIKDTGGLSLYLKIKLRKKYKVAISPDDEDFRKRRFYGFRDEFLNRTNTMFRDAYDINKDVDYSAFIVGSDIIWAPKRVDNFRADGYFLKFANKGEKRISYAASLDCKPGKKLNRKKKYYRENLKNIDCVSIREKCNIPFIQELTDKKVYECCDPAFLVEPSYYNKMISTAKVADDGKKFLYVYILEINQDIVDYANKLAKDKGLKICYFSQYHDNYIGDSENCYIDGPAEFLYRLKNAEYVLTNSFHCVVFSLLFRKQFLSFFRSSISIKSSELLKKFNLTERVISPSNNIDIDKPIDFASVDKIIDEMRINAFDYLKDALDDIK